MKKIITLLLVSATLTLINVSTSANENSEERQTTPSPLLDYMQNNSGFNFEEFLLKALQPIRTYATDGLSLTSEDAREYEEVKKWKIQSNIFTDIIQRDLNFDGTVTKEEFKKSFVMLNSGFSRRSNGNSEETEQQQRMENAFSERDLNNDGKITLQEMSSPSKNRLADYYNDSLNPLTEILKLDPNKDARLTAKELEKLARDMFSTFDRNDDGTIGEDEVVQVKIKKEERDDYKKMIVADLLRAKKCKVPTLPDNHQIVIAAAHSGRTASNISVAGQTEATDVLSLEIGQGTESLYVVAIGVEPIIWTIKGDVSRVSNLILIGPAMKDKDQETYIGAGATGIDRNKVSFADYQLCGIFNADVSEGKDAQKMIESTDSAIKTLLGQKPHIRAQHKYTTEDTEAGKVSIKLPPWKDVIPPPPPKGYNAAAWDFFVKVMPGGLADLRLEEIVADAPPEPYIVMPYWAGIAQLLGSGALTAKEGEDISQSRQFTLTKEIPYYPSGLYGGHSVGIFIPNTIKLPTNHAGHSRIIREEDKEDLVIVP